MVSLERYTRRHNNILQLLAEWISTTRSVNQSLYVDIHPDQWISVDKVFQQSSRPDLVLVDNSEISILELTVCHETHLTKSKQYKLDKYINIREKLQPQFSKYSVEIYSIEVSTIGFISDCSDFQKSMKLPKFSKSFIRSLIVSVLFDSYNIYCKRNTS